MTKKAKGKRPIYLENPENDKLLAMIMALAGEVSVLRERMDTIEQLLQTKGVISIEEIDAYQPNDIVNQEREKWRANYIARVLKILEKDE